VELFKHRDRLLAATRLPEDKLLEALNELLESLQLVEAASIPIGIWMQARRLCDGVDMKDTPVRRIRHGPSSSAGQMRPPPPSKAPVRKRG